MKTNILSNIIAASALSLSFAGPSNAQTEVEHGQKAEHDPERIEVEVEIRDWGQDEQADSSASAGKKRRVEKLSYVSYNKDRSLFVGSFQDGWFEIVSLHDAKTRKQLGSVYCEGGLPGVFRFSEDNQFLGAKASVGWYVWKIPSFKRVIVLGDTDFVKFSAEQDAALKDQGESE